MTTPPKALCAEDAGVEPAVIGSKPIALPLGESSIKKPPFFCNNLQIKAANVKKWRFFDITLAIIVGRN